MAGVDRSLRWAVALSVALHLLALAGLWPGQAASVPATLPPLSVDLLASPAAGAAAVGAQAAGQPSRLPKRASQPPAARSAGVPAPVPEGGAARRQAAAVSVPVAPKGASKDAAAGASPSAGTATAADARDTEGKTEGKAGRAESAGRAGGGSPAMHRAEYLHNPQPPYPERSRQLGEQGQVLLRVRVSKDGRALAVAVQRSSGYRRLDRSAEEAAAGWKFAPARQGGEPVESELTVPVEFRLPG